MSVDIYSVNFKDNGLWQRVYEMCGGSQTRAENWWITPLPHAPFNLRTPKELMENGEWDSVRLFIEDKTGNSIAPVDYGPQSSYNSYRDGRQPHPDDPKKNFQIEVRGRVRRRKAGLKTPGSIEYEM